MGIKQTLQKVSKTLEKLLPEYEKQHKATRNRQPHVEPTPNDPTTKLVELHGDVTLSRKGHRDEYVLLNGNEILLYSEWRGADDQPRIDVTKTTAITIPTDTIVTRWLQPTDPKPGGTKPSTD